MNIMFDNIKNEYFQSTASTVNTVVMLVFGLLLLIALFRVLFTRKKVIANIIVIFGFLVIAGVTVVSYVGPLNDKIPTDYQGYFGKKWILYAIVGGIWLLALLCVLFRKGRHIEDNDLDISLPPYQQQYAQPNTVLIGDQRGYLSPSTGNYLGHSGQYDEEYDNGYPMQEYQTQDKSAPIRRQTHSPVDGMDFVVANAQAELRVAENIQQNKEDKAFIKKSIEEQTRLQIEVAKLQAEKEFNAKQTLANEAIEQAKMEAEIAKLEAEAVKLENETIKKEQERLQAEKEKQEQLALEAEIARLEIETAKQEAEAAKIEAERIKQEAEENKQRQLQELELQRQAQLEQIELEQARARQEIELAKQEIEKNKQEQLAKLEQERQESLNKQQLELEQQKAREEELAIQAEIAKLEAEAARLEAEANKQETERAKLEAEEATKKQLQELEVQKQEQLAQLVSQQEQARLDYENAKQLKLAELEQERLAIEIAREQELANQKQGQLTQFVLQHEQAKIDYEKAKQAKLAQLEQERLAIEKASEKELELAKLEVAKAKQEALLAKNRAELDSERARLELDFANQTAKQQLELSKLRASHQAIQSGIVTKSSIAPSSPKMTLKERLEAQRIAREQVNKAPRPSLADRASATPRLSLADRLSKRETNKEPVKTVLLDNSDKKSTTTKTPTLAERLGRTTNSTKTSPITPKDNTNLNVNPTTSVVVDRTNSTRLSLADRIKNRNASKSVAQIDANLSNPSSTQTVDGGATQVIKPIQTRLIDRLKNKESAAIKDSVAINDKSKTDQVATARDRVSLADRIKNKRPKTQDADSNPSIESTKLEAKTETKPKSRMRFERDEHGKMVIKTDD